MTGATEVTFCFTDIEGSTALLRALGEDAYEPLLERHRELIRGALAHAGGLEIKTEGDGFFLAFDDAAAAIAFAVDAQRALGAEPWPTPIRVRMGLHRGTAQRRPDGDFVAMAVHQAARVAGAASGGQVLVTPAAVADAPPDVRLQRLGAYRLRDFDGPVELAQLAGPGLPATLPPPRAARADHGLRLPKTSLVGREHELSELARLLVDQSLVTLVGTGGVGKTRLALEAAAANAASFPDGLHTADMSPVAGPNLVDATLAAAADVRPEPGIEAIDALAAVIGTGRRLLVVDSCEHVLDGVAVAFERLADDCPNLVVLATSTEPIRVPHERIVMIDPLGVSTAEHDDAMGSDAVRLVVQRATDTGGHFDPSDEELGQIAEIARRLDGIPSRSSWPPGASPSAAVAQVLAALDDRFSLLTNGFRTALPRHRTLEAMVAWSVEQLKPAARGVVGATVGVAWRVGTLGGARSLRRQLERGDRPASTDRPVARRRRRRSARAHPPARHRAHVRVARALTDDQRADIDDRRLQWLDDRFVTVGSATADYLADVDALIPDVRAAVATARADAIERAAQLLGACCAWFEVRGLWVEGVELHEGLVAACPPGAARALATASMAQLLAMGADPARAGEMARLVLDDPAAPAVARAMAAVAGTSIFQAVPDDGPDLLAEAVALAGSKTALGIAARSRIALRKQIFGDAEGAAEDLATVIRDTLDIGVPAVEATARIDRGGVMLRLGRLDEAEAELEAGRALATSSQQRSLAAAALTNLSLVALHRGDPRAGACPGRGTTRCGP